jgi:hypothetical protein
LEAVTRGLLKPVTEDTRVCVKAMYNFSHDYRKFTRYATYSPIVKMEAMYSLETFGKFLSDSRYRISGSTSIHHSHLINDLTFHIN